MKRPFFYFLLIASCFSFTGKKNIAPQSYFGPHEKLEYRVHYGFINAGEAIIEIHPQLHKVNDKICYKASIIGHSSNAFDLALRIRDTWVTYIDTVTTIPQKFHRNIEEGHYRLKENVFYDYTKGIATVEREGKNEKDKEIKTYPVPKRVQDLVSGYFYLRTLDYNHFRIGDTIKINAFLEDKLYDFRIRYLGKTTVDTKFGSIKAFKLSPIMPTNSLFNGENSIKLWLSDDKNRIALKIEAELFVGSVEIDLKSYQGLHNPVFFNK